jgi:2-keto-3-deoxy-L-rhamnonate aldolase RhmA
MTGPELLNARLRQAPVIGTFVKLPRPEVIDVLALAGFDFAVCDYEHGQMDERAVLATVRAGDKLDLPVVVRVAAPDRGLVNRILEAGAAGIQLARADGRASLELMDLLRYPPRGTRSLSLAQPAAGYGSMPIDEYVERANEFSLGVGQFETPDYAEHLDDAVAALDVAFIGPTDLSLGLGEKGRAGGPKLEAAVAKIERAASRSNTPLGVFAEGNAGALDAIGRGYGYIVVASDIAMLKVGAREALAGLKPGGSTNAGTVDS